MDGSTRSNASSAEPPCAVGSVSGPTTPSISMTEPGQPCVMISGSAPSCDDFTWMKWMSTPSISVLNIGSAFSSASQLRALRPVVDQLLARPAHRSDAPPKVGDRLVGHVHPEGAYFGAAHDGLPS